MPCRLPLLLTIALASLPLGGCQSGPSAPTPATQPTAKQAFYTPDGDRLDGPIPGNHWPVTLARGGGIGRGGSAL